MKVKVTVVGIVQTNCYIVVNESKGEAIIIDPADNVKKIMKELDANKIKPVAILLTHGHFDHIMAVNELSDSFGIPIYASEHEKQLLTNPQMNGSVRINKEIVVTPNHLLKDGQHLNLAGMNIEAIHTPGHTSGELAIILQRMVWFLLEIPCFMNQLAGLIFQREITIL